MSKLKIYHTDKLTENEVKVASDFKADVVLCNEIKAKGPFDFKTEDASQFRIEGGWLAYNENAKLLLDVKEKWPGIFEFDGVNLEKAFQKALFWCNRKAGYLLNASENLYPEEIKLNKVELHQGSPLKTALMFIKYYLKALKGGRFHIPDYKINKSVTVGFLIEDMFEFGVLKNVISNFTKEEVILVLPPFHRFKTMELDELKSQGYVIVECKTGTWVHLPFTFPIKFNKKESWMVQMILNNLQPISQCLMWGESLFQSSMKVLVTVAQENTPFGHILSEIAGNHHKMVVNTMNGIKYGEGNDADTSFQRWMVWDDDMKNLLIEKVGTNAEQLVVAGSLSQDDVMNHTYNNSLQIDEETLQTKKVISVMSTRDLRPDKVEALTTLYAWAEERKDVIILYRPHPAERKESYLLPDKNKVSFFIVHPETKDAKISLLDQLLKSDLVINFGSTVSIESKWTHTPCITYEKKPYSWLYCVDNLTVFHLNSRDGLLNFLNNLSKKKKYIKHVDYKKSSSVYAENIKKWRRIINI